MSTKLVRSAALKPGSNVRLRIGHEDNEQRLDDTWYKVSDTRDSHGNPLVVNVLTGQLYSAMPESIWEMNL